MRSTTKEPIVVVEPTRSIVTDASRVCNELGIKKGMPLSSAYTLSNSINIKYRDKEREIEALKKVAMSLLQYSSHISVKKPDSILVEIGASERLFLADKNIPSQILESIFDLGFDHHIAVSPTPLSAIWMARSGLNKTIRHTVDLAKHINSLPASVIQIQKKTNTEFHKIGIQTIGQLEHVPRSSIVKRWGKGVIEQLDRAFGRVPDPQVIFEPPERFDSEISLNLPASSVDQMIFGIQRLLRELVVYLQIKQRGVVQFELKLIDESKNSHAFECKLSRASQNLKHLTELARGLLDKKTIPSRVETIQLGSIEELPIDPSNRDIFHIKQQIDTNPDILIDRLRTKFGNKFVHGITCYPDHRPEKSWQKTLLNGRRQEINISNRPTWLLQKPKALDSTLDIPYLNGPLTIIDGPERIETGWWDDHDVKRDYFLAITESQSQVWIYKDLISCNWFLHGIFS